MTQRAENSNLHHVPQAINKVLSYFSIGILTSTLLIASGVDILTSFRTAAILILISSTGLVAWLAILRGNREICFPEAIGMGLALGFIACASLMLFLRPFGFYFYGATIPLAIANSFFLLRRGRKFLNTSRLNFSPQDTALIVFIVFFGLYLSTPALLISALVVLLIMRINKSENYLLTYSMYAAIWSAIILTVLYLSFTSNAPEPFIFGQGAESVPREAWANSIVMFGPNENIAIFGNPLRYHWFSFAVFGMITRLSGLIPMVLFNSGLSAVIDLICVGGIIWSTTLSISKRKSIALLAVVIAYGTVSLNHPYAIITDSSPDATSWLVFVAAFAFALLNYSDFSPRVGPIFLAALGAATILSNGGYGTSLAVGLVFWILAIIARDKKLVLRKSISEIMAFGCTGIAMALSYFAFLTPSNYSTSTIDLSLRFLTATSGLLFVISFYSSRVITMPSLTRLVPAGFSYFYFGLAVVSIPGFFVFRNSTWNLTIQFTMPALILFATPLALACSKSWSEWVHSKRLRHLLALAFGALGFFLQVLFSAIQWKHYERFNSLALSEYLVIVPIVAILFVVVLFTSFSKTVSDLPSRFTQRFAYFFKQVFIISTVVCGLGLGLGYSIRGQTRDLVDLQSGKDISKEVSPVVSYEMQSAMIWLRSNSSKNDRTATNFLCGAEVRSFFRNCSAKNNHLAISAYAQRRVLVEGNSWSNVGTVFTETQRLPVPIVGEGIFTLQVKAPQWLTERISMSHRFASRPDKIAADYMKKMGITWFVVDKSKQMPSSWSPFATIAFENSEVVILKTNF